MYFEHTDAIWRAFPELVAGIIQAGGVDSGADVDPSIAELTMIARDRLGGESESRLPEIQAWRRAFARMGLKPTQYRCASESLLRRFRKEGELPRIHPLIDLCNAASLAFATPVAVFDISAIGGHIEVRRATGGERCLSFAGEIEHPDPDEVIFADAAGQVHARRWTHRQSGSSAVHPTTSDVLIVAEAMHDTATTDVLALIDTLAGRIGAAWVVEPRTAMLSAGDPRFTFCRRELTESRSQATICCGNRPEWSANDGRQASPVSRHVEPQRNISPAFDAADGGRSFACGLRMTGVGSGCRVTGLGNQQHQGWGLAERSGS